MSTQPRTALVKTLRAAALAAACSLAVACSQPSPEPLRATGDAAAALTRVEYSDATFEQLYPTFLLRKLKAGPKAAAWQNYVGKWVRWTGTLVSFSANGLTFKQLPQTVTFDVSLWIENGQRAKLRQRLKLGDRVSYIGRLDSYDDVFRTLYLTHGDIIAVAGKPDAGAH